MKIAIMQPYVFPYLPYFQLINAVDTFVFYDNVNFIKKGYIHRNALLMDGKKTVFTIPCKAISQHKKINETFIDFESKLLNKLKVSIDQNYKKAPYFQEVRPVLEHFFKNIASDISMSEAAVRSVMSVCEYLGLRTKFRLSSIDHQNSDSLVKAARLIDISKQEAADTYVNPIGGKDLYTFSEFAAQDMDLKFLESHNIVYKQFENEFVPWLSILDVLMFNSKEDINDFLNAYTLQ